MTKITCPCVECVHNGNRYRCNADKINLKYRNMVTVSEGRVDMWICDRYEIDERTKELVNEFMKCMKGVRSVDNG